MTIEEFMKRNDVKCKRTVMKWLNEKRIPGVYPDEVTGELIFPEHVRSPYQAPSNISNDEDVIRASIVKACLAHKYISKESYPKLSQVDYDTYISQLKEVGYITEKVIDGVVYYYSTTKSNELRGVSDYKKRKIIAEVIKGAIQLSPPILQIIQLFSA